MKNLISFALTFGCVVAEPIGEKPIDNWISATEVSVVEPTIDDCSRGYAPDIYTQEYVEWAVGEWSTATECDIHVADNGIPIHMVDFIVKPDKPTEHVWGISHTNSERHVYQIFISRESPHPFATTEHEIGHDLSNLDPADTDGHTETGIMGAPILDMRITEESLAMICGGLPCKEFNVQPLPEQ